MKDINIFTVVNDTTKCTWAFLKKKKSEVRPLVSFYTMVQTQFRVSIKSIISDNGPDFCKIYFYSSHGIFTPKELCLRSQKKKKKNSIAERKRHHILSIARALNFNPTFL